MAGMFSHNENQNGSIIIYFKVCHHSHQIFTLKHKQNNRSHFLWNVLLCSCPPHFISRVQFTGPNASTARSLKDNSVSFVRDVWIKKRSVWLKCGLFQLGRQWQLCVWRLKDFQSLVEPVSTRTFESYLETRIES